MTMPTQNSADGDRPNPETWKRLLALDAASPIPLYYQLKQLITSIVRKLDSGHPMPTEVELCEWSKVSRVTVRRALAELIQEGYLVSRRGRGTFVAPQRAETPLDRPIGFTETMRRLGYVPATRLVSIEEIEDPHICTLLELTPPAAVYVIERLRLRSGDPCMLERTHIPVALAPGLREHDLNCSLYQVLKEKYGLEPATGAESIIAAVPPAKIVRLLQMEAGDPSLQTFRFTRTVDGALMEYSIRYARADMCSFIVSLGAGNELRDRTSLSVVGQCCA